MTGARALLEIEDVVTLYGGGKRLLGKPRPVVRGVDGVSLSLKAGQALGLVGESGCGKTTLAKTILGLVRETSGTVRLDGQVVSGLSVREARAARPHDPICASGSRRGAGSVVEHRARARRGAAHSWRDRSQRAAAAR